jgi:diguanylate cyclase (GGDEF)-like protein
MRLEDTRLLVAYTGVFVQLAGSLFLAALFVVLRRSGRRRDYFNAWTNAWVAIAVAIGAVAVAFLVPTFTGTLEGGTPPLVRVLFFLYQFAKLVYCIFIVQGTALYLRGVRTQRWMRNAVLGAAGYALFTTLIAADPRRVLFWQSPVMVVSLAACAILLWRLPESRRSIGSRTTATLFLLTSLLWVAYMIAFTRRVDTAAAASGSALVGLLFYSSYLDTMLEILLGYGMIVMLMEDAKREVDDAHAELAVAHDHLRRSALLDPLTGALNRRAFSEGVGLEAIRASAGTVIVLDMDNLKAVNDAHGHAAGDELLRSLVETMRSTMRPSDRLYRWGGDEFLLVLPSAAPEEVLPVIRARIAAATPVSVGVPAEQVRAQVSTGAAAYSGGEALESAIQRADVDMYREKGRRKSQGVPQVVQVD